MNRKKSFLASFFAVTCALSFSNSSATGIEPRIIGGGNAVKAKWRFMVSLADGNSLSHFCGASYLGGRYILTAAHCLVKNNGYVKVPSSIKAYIDAYDLTNGTADKYSDIAAVYIHPQYDDFRFKNDIAILELAVDPNSSGAGLTNIGVASIVKGEILRVAGW